MRIRAKETTDSTEVIVVLFCNAKGTTGWREKAGERTTTSSALKSKKKLLKKHEFAKSILVFLVVTKELPTHYSATLFLTLLCLFEGGNCTWCVFEGSPLRFYLPDEAHSRLKAMADAMFFLLTLLILKDSPLISPLFFFCTLSLLIFALFWPPGAAVWIAERRNAKEDHYLVLVK